MGRAVHPDGRENQGRPKKSDTDSVRKSWIYKKTTLVVLEFYKITSEKDKNWQNDLAMECCLKSSIKGLDELLSYLVRRERQSSIITIGGNKKIK